MWSASESLPKASLGLKFFPKFKSRWFSFIKSNRSAEHIFDSFLPYASSKSNLSKPNWFGIITYSVSSTLLAIQWWPPIDSSHHTSSLSLKAIPFDSYVPYFSSKLPKRSTPSRALLIYGRTNTTISSSPIPPGFSLSVLVLGWYFTKGSAPKTLGLDVIVSVAVIPTLSSLIPVAAQIPFLSSTLGDAVYLSGFLSNSISKWPILLLYLVPCFLLSTTIVFFTSKWPSSVLAIIVEPSYDTFLPTSKVVQAIITSYSIKIIALN